MQRFLFHTALGLTVLANAHASEPSVLLDTKTVDVSQLQITNARVAREEGGLHITGTAATIQADVVYNVPESRRNLFHKRYLEFEVENRGTDALRFTFWALSGSGWGGVSTWTGKEYKTPPPGNVKAAGFELLPAGKKQKFKIDLHAKYPGPDAIFPAVNAAEIRALEMIAGNGKSHSSLVLGDVTATGEWTEAAPDLSKRVLVPEVEHASPAPGKRVYQTLPGWEKTKVTHVLTLPKDWKPGGRYPIIVEYTGNVFYDKFCHSTGFTDQGNMAYGLSKGVKYICLNLPFITEDGQSEQPAGWGSPEKTIDYCLQAVRFVCDTYGGNSNEVFFTGFSRGSIAANYIALREDRIAGLWAGFIGTGPGQAMQPGKGWKGSEIGWNERAERFKKRPFIVQHPNYGYGVHVDVEYLEDSPSTLSNRAWMEKVLQEKVKP